MRFSRHSPGVSGNTSLTDGITHREWADSDSRTDLEQSLTDTTRHRRRGPMAVSLVCWTAAAGITAWLCTIRFHVNDDTVMAALASGDFTGRPSSHLVFISLLPGLVISRLHRYGPDLPWYAITLWTLNIISLSVTSSLWWLCRRRVGWQLNTVYWLGLLALASFMFVAPTFTVTAFMLGVSGVLLVGTRSVLTGRWSTIGGMLLLVAAASLRIDAFYGSLLMSVPLLVLAGRRIGWRRSTLLLAVLAVAVGGIIGIDRLGENDDWSRYREFNALRGEMHGTKQLERLLLGDLTQPKVQAMLDDNGWSSADLQLFGYWMIDNPEIYNIRTLSRLHELVEQEQDDNSWAGAWQQVTADHLVLVLLLVATTALVAMTGRRRAVFAVSQTVWLLAVALWVAYDSRFPDRVAIPMLLGTSLLMVVAAASIDPDPTLLRSRSVRRTAALLATATLSLLAAGLWQQLGPVGLSEANQSDIESAVSLKAELRQIDASGVFIVLGSVLDDVGALGRPGPYGWRELITTGWNSQSPAQSNRIAALELTDNLPLSAFREPHVYFVGAQANATVMVRSLRFHTGVRAQPLVAGRTPDGSLVFRLIPRVGTRPDPPRNRSESAPGAS